MSLRAITLCAFRLVVEIALPILRGLCAGLVQRLETESDCLGSFLIDTYDVGRQADFHS